MEPTAIFEGMIADMIDYELAERNTQAVVREQSVEEEQASRLVDGFQPVCGIFSALATFGAKKSRILKTRLLSNGQRQKRSVLMLTWERNVTLSVFTAT